MKPDTFVARAQRIGFGRLTPHPVSPHTYEFMMAEYDCLLFLDLDKSGDVESGQFYIGFGVTVDDTRLNTWNRNNRFVKAYRRNDNGLALEMDFFVADAKDGYLADMAGMWSYQLSKLYDHFA